MARKQLVLAGSAVRRLKLREVYSSDFAYWLSLLVLWELLVILAALWLVPVLTAASAGALLPTDPTILGAGA
jgi:hypothetical protein